MAISSVYCTATDIKDVYPNIDEYDGKTPIYGWESATCGGTQYYRAFNVGSVENLFVDGINMQATKYSKTDASTNTDEVLDDSETGIDVVNGAKLNDDSFIMIDSEIMAVTAIGGNTLTVSRGQLGTLAAAHLTNTDVYQILKIDTSVDTWYHDSTNDFILINLGVTGSTDPTNLNMEAGADWSTLQTRIIKNASRYFDSRVDANLPRDQWKDKEGNYDYIVVRTSALIAAYFLINAREPGSELALRFLEEANFNLEQLNSGKTKLSHQVSSDASQGILREVVTPQAANPLHIVDTRGAYTGSYDLLKIVITTAGAIGTAKFSVYSKGVDNLKTQEVVKSETINGQYQSIGNGLQIRFQGKDSTSAATLGATPDEWELECWGVLESFDGSPGSSGNTRGTRKDISNVMRREYRKL